ncbi:MULTISPECIES: heme exporter protein CcmD [Aliivibrio]|jgi:heme exporter protein D|uniref:Heme exporter protein D n=3 Tax=Aliivibrio TaxID=511678 RepID=A0A1B9P231_ALILO|nr:MULTISPECIES: heme exporter protein CcmD [Aliivibrio]AZL85428.1 heme exporter protein CcmD [Aliivibrio salmonicida]MBB1315705.1 heme exporter protein CcmD [Aliivibrio sp. SR45-2]OCH22414.1 heme exporter protein CcmD [Aliivibrio logei]OEF19750.1 heme exporter protein CcmD [Aliivibrio logei 5S-186]CAQ79962.1 cytochrome c-type biogenesis protein CcmD [Aliivibrio salmonicida LFI1238]
MHFETLSDFFAMGGYAAYVWGAFGATFLSLFWILFSSLGKRRQLLKEIEQRMAREERIKKAKTMENTL